jgi:hypothetical protein
LWAVGISNRPTTLSRQLLVIKVVFLGDYEG